MTQTSPPRGTSYEDADTVEIIKGRRHAIKRADEGIRMAAVGRWTFVSLYVFAATVAQVANGALIAYLVRSS